MGRPTVPPLKRPVSREPQRRRASPACPIQSDRVPPPVLPPLGTKRQRMPHPPAPCARVLALERFLSAPVSSVLFSAPQQNPPARAARPGGAGTAYKTNHTVTRPGNVSSKWLGVEGGVAGPGQGRGGVAGPGQGRGGRVGGRSGRAGGEAVPHPGPWGSRNPPSGFAQGLAAACLYSLPGFGFPKPGRFLEACPALGSHSRGPTLSSALPTPQNVPRPPTPVAPDLQTALAGLHACPRAVLTV